MTRKLRFARKLIKMDVKRPQNPVMGPSRDFMERRPRYACAQNTRMRQSGRAVSFAYSFCYDHATDFFFYRNDRKKILIRHGVSKLRIIRPYIVKNNDLWLKIENLGLLFRR